MKIIFRTEWIQYPGAPFQFTFLNVSFYDAKPNWHILQVGLLGFNWNLHWGTSKEIHSI